MMKTKIPYSIGDRVRITHQTTMGYDEHKNRIPYVAELQDKGGLIAFVVGAVNRPLGQYNNATGGGDWSSGDAYDPPYLSVSGTITLIQCKTRMFGKIIEAQLEHVTKEV